MIICLRKNSQIDRLKREVLEMARKRSDFASVYNTTVQDLEEFQDLRPIHEKNFQTLNENEKKDQVIRDQDIEIRNLKEIVEKLNREL